MGHTFKKLHEAITIAKEGIQPVLPEDLIFRFAKRLEFGPMMTKVAEDAIRMVQRMSMDWMVMGRRPAPINSAQMIFWKIVTLFLTPYGILQPPGVKKTLQTFCLSIRFSTRHVNIGNVLMILLR